MESASLRQLAIRLACIHVDDRVWVLEQLSDEQRQTIDGLLQEINELGLAKDPTVIAAILGQPNQAEFANLASILPTDVALHDLVAKAEHPCWAALLLQGHSVQQRNLVMSALPAIDQIRHWDQQFADIAVPPALVMALRDHLMPNVEASHVQG
ncbi:MAG: hypothetical protein Q8K94_00185 [Moraxellaceae bacterium]|nr:hypothetical protein [Moraxellaceae bacterium]MDP1775012.1 hypothetical protein [Moraxellaceae bacterium]